MKFVSLHGHTSFSTGDAHGTPAQHIDRVKELGMTALAITEHGSVSSHVQLEKAALDAGIKPIFGVEAYVADPNTKQKFHQTILAMNENGYRQLSRLVTRSYDEGMYYHPTVHADWRPRDRNGQRPSSPSGPAETSAVSSSMPTTMASEVTSGRSATSGIIRLYVSKWGSTLRSGTIPSPSVPPRLGCRKSGT